MKSRQKKRDLFTVDTVGDQNDSDNEKGDSEILYSVDGTVNTGDSEDSDEDVAEEEEEETEEKGTENDDNDEDDDDDNDEEDKIDYGGKKSRCNSLNHKKYFQFIFLF